MDDRYKPGGFYRIDDRSGFKVRGYTTEREWTGLQTRDPDIRNPQDFVRARKDQQRVPFSRRPPNYFIFVDFNDDFSDDFDAP